MFPEYNGFTAQQATDEGMRLVTLAANGQIMLWGDLVDRLTALRTIYVNSSGPHSSPRR
jgi:hypothetical protein